MSLRSDFFSVIEAFAEGVVVYGPDSAPIAWNQAALDMLGVSPDELVDPSKRSGEWQLLRADLSPIEPHELPSVEARVTKKAVYRRRLAVRLEDRKYRELLVSSMPLLNDVGDVDFVVSALLDVTRELAVVSELRVFERFFDMSADMFVVTDSKSSVLQVNDALLATLGGERQRYLGMGLVNNIHPDDLTEIMKLGPSAISPWEFTVRMRATSGEWRHISWRIVLGTAPQEGATYFARGVDVTERLAEQRELSRSRELVNDAFELAELAVLQRDVRSGDVTITSRLRELLQLDDARPGSLESFVMQEDLAAFKSYRDAAPQAGERRPLSLRIRTTKGAVRDVRVWSRITRDDQQTVTRELTVVQDVTQQSLESARHRLTERLNSLGTMAAGVAHEINNPLSFVLANLNVVSETLHDLPPAPGVDMVDLRDAVSEAIEGAERVRQIVLSMRPFARTDEAHRAHCDVIRIVHASLNLARNELRHRARIVTDLKPVGSVWANEARLGQVFLNLLINAAHSIPDGHAANHEVRITSREERGYVFVTVRDTGRGIPSDVMPRIFDPFFSTKGAGEGVGLGLFISQSIVQESGGELTAESAPGMGSTFEVRLPIATASAANKQAAAPRARALKVLIVDDEPSILRSIERLLGKEHALTLAYSGREALTLLGSRDDFDLVLCDMMMPELSGIDVWNQLSPEQRARFVFMTGGTFTERAEAFVAANNPPVLAKPFSATSLDNLLARAQSR